MWVLALAKVLVLSFEQDNILLQSLSQIGTCKLNAKGNPAMD